MLWTNTQKCKSPEATLQYPLRIIALTMLSHLVVKVFSADSSLVVLVATSRILRTNGPSRNN